MYKYLGLLLILLTFACKSETSKVQKEDVQLREVIKVADAPVIDGKATEDIWKTAKSYPINQRWLGELYSGTDFSGSYKLCWTPEALYLLVKIQDDVLYNPNEDPLVRYWDDDCVEIFIDEDNSGGIHQYNHNAFAYHVDLNGDVVDIIAENTPKLFNSHILSKRFTSGSKSLWEFKISIYNDTYNNNGNNSPVTLSAGKKIGFALAYCDNDQSEERENFIGSIPIQGDDKNQGWIDASIFGTLVLKE